MKQVQAIFREPIPCSCMRGATKRVRDAGKRGPLEDKGGQGGRKVQKLVHWKVKVRERETHLPNLIS